MKIKHYSACSIVLNECAKGRWKVKLFQWLHLKIPICLIFIQTYGHCRGNKKQYIWYTGLNVLRSSQWNYHKGRLCYKLNVCVLTPWRLGFGEVIIAFIKRFQRTPLFSSCRIQPEVASMNQKVGSHKIPSLPVLLILGQPSELLAINFCCL